MNAITSMAIKDLRLLARDKLGLFWIFVFPLLFALFFGAITANMTDRPAGALSMAVVDYDVSNFSRAYIEKLSQSGALKLVKLDKEQAYSQVRRGRLVAYLVIHKGFQHQYGFLGKGNLVQVTIDPSRQAEAGYLKGILVESAYRLLDELLFSDASALQAQAQNIIAAAKHNGELSASQRKLLRQFMQQWQQFLAKADKSTLRRAQSFRPQVEIPMQAITTGTAKPGSSFEISFPAAMLWGILGCVVTFSISMVQERMAGTFLRLRLAPVPGSYILLSKGLSCLVTCLAVMTVFLAIGNVLLGVRIGNWSGMAMAIAAIAICFVGIMMFICVLGKTLQRVAGAGWAILMIMAMIGGGTVPLIAMPPWMQLASHISPVKWGILAVEGAIWRNFQLTEIMVPVIILLAIGALFSTIGLIIFSYSERV